MNVRMICWFVGCGLSAHQMKPLYFTGSQLVAAFSYFVLQLPGNLMYLRGGHPYLCGFF